MKRINKKAVLWGAVLALLGGLLCIAYVKHCRYYASTELARYVREHIEGHPTPISSARERPEKAEGEDFNHGLP